MPVRLPRPRHARTHPLRVAVAWLAVIALGVLLAPPRTTRAEEPEAWSTSSSGLVGRSVDSLRITDKGDMLANVYGQGAMLSKDKGQTWTRVMKGVRPLPGARDPVRITLDPKGKAIYLVTLGRVYRSEDPESGWTPITSGLTSYSINGKQNAELVYEVAVDPDKSARLLAGTRSEGDWHGGLFESSDSGQKWTQISGSNLKDTRLGQEAWPIVLKPGTDKLVVVGGRRGVWFSDERGKKFEYAPLGQGLPDIRWLAGGLKGSKVVVAADARGIFVSDKDGADWPDTPALPGDAIWVGIPSESRKRIYGLMRGTGVVVCGDLQGKKWTQHKNGELGLYELAFPPKDAKTVYGLSHIEGLMVSEDDGATFKQLPGNLGTVPLAVVAVAVNPKDGTQVAVTEDGVVFTSAERGDKWDKVGQAAQQVTALRMDPLGNLYACGRQLLKSTDNGATWKAVLSPADPLDAVVDAQVGPDGRLWALLERALEIRASPDGGETWTLQGKLAEPGGLWATCLAVDARSSDTLLAGTRPAPRGDIDPKAKDKDPKDLAGGALGSTDGGKTWLDLKAGLRFDAKNLPPRAQGVLIDPVTGVLYLAIQGYDVYARQPLSGADAKGADEPWVSVRPDADLKTPSFSAFALAREGNDTRLAVYALGEASRRAFVMARGSELKAAVVTQREGKPPPEKLWERRPDPRAQLSGFMGDPRQPGRWLAGNVGEDGGVKVLERPGGTPPPAPAPAPAPGPAPAPEPAPAPAPAKAPEVPEGLLGFSASSDFSVGAWNLKAGSAQYLRGHGGEVQGVALAPDGSLLATASKDKTVRLWTAKDLKPAQVFTVEGSCSVLQFTADGKFLLVGLDESGVVLSIEVATQVITRLEGHTAGVMGMALAADGRLYTVARDKTLRAWDLATGKATGLKVDLPAEPFSVAVWDQGQRVLVAGREPMLRAFGTADGKEAATLPLPDPMHSGLALDRKAGLLYVGTEGGVQVVELATLALKGKWAGPAKAVMSLALTADGAWLLGGDEENGLWLWSTAAGSVGWSRTGAHTAAVNAVVLSR